MKIYPADRLASGIFIHIVCYKRESDVTFLYFIGMLVLYDMLLEVRAIRCYEKAGFQKEGMLREHHFSGGAYEAVLVMSILSEC